MTHHFTAVGHHGLCLISDDATAWRVGRIGKEGEVFRAVAFGNGRFAAVGGYGGDNIFTATADGKAWHDGKKNAQYSQYIRGLGFGGTGMFLALGGDPGAVGDSRPFVVTSRDGEAWSEPAQVVGKHMLRRVAYGNGRFVAVGDRGRRASSPDGKEWTDAPDVKAIDTLIDVAFGKGMFVGVGLHGLRMASADGLAWTARQVGPEGEHLNTVLWADDRFVAVGAGATYTSADGLTWERRENHNAPSIAAYGRGVFVGSGWKGRILKSADAIEWTQVFKAEHHVEAIVAGEA